MDNYVEQIIAKKAEPKDIAFRLLIFFGFSLVVALSLILTLLLHFPMLLVLGAGAIYLMWYMLGNTSLEYEYIITNNELDVDKIMGRRKRKRLITLKLNLTEEWGVYDNFKSDRIQATVSAHDCRYSNLWYLVTAHEKHGKTLTLFSPNEDVLIAVNKFVPYNLRKQEISLAAAKKEAQEMQESQETIKTDQTGELDN